MLRGTIVYELLQLAGYWFKTLSTSKNTNLRSERIQFGPHAKQYLMLYSPLKIDPNKPLIIYYHGGGWIFGKPELFSKKAELFTQLGYQIIMPCYRKVPLYHADHILEDVTLMINHLRTLQKEGKINQLDRIILGGVSAGANLASLLYFRKDLHEQAVFSQQNFCGLFLYAPPFDLSGMKKTPVLYRYAGRRNSKRFYNASPINFIENSRPIPILCTHGNKDAFVQQAASQSLQKKYSDLYPNMLQYQTIDNATHLDAASWAHTDNAMRKELVAWLAEVS